MALLPDEPILDYALAQLYHSIGEYKKAIPIYEELSYGNGEIASATQLNFFLGDCHNAIGEFETALQYLEKIPADEHFPDSYFQLGFSPISNLRNMRAPSPFLINCSKRTMLT